MFKDFLCADNLAKWLKHEGSCWVCSAMRTKLSSNGFMLSVILAMASLKFTPCSRFSDNVWTICF